MFRFSTQKFHLLKRFSLSSPFYSSFKSSSIVLSNDITNSYGIYCFNKIAMKDYFDKKSFQEISYALENKEQLPEKLLQTYIAGIHRWALDRDCTHVSHVIQPLNGKLAEKHDVLFSINSKDDSINTELDIKTILSTEPDASSFPNGNSRNTSAARGNAIWDPRSYLTICKLGEETESPATTLRIPSILYGWNNISLDFKTSLLRSEIALEKAVLNCLNITGSENNHMNIKTNCGIEQEFFFIDERYYNERPDLQQTGRTLIGCDPSKIQDHGNEYFNLLSTRKQECMFDIEKELWKLGIPNSTRHREVAPGQYEMAPFYQESNQAIDNNLLMMDVMKEVSLRHGLVCLFHEKPYANINGSGKHNNWSFGSNIDPCFFNPSSPNFLLSITAFIRACHIHSDLLRAAVATSGNDHRLGGHEAPPGVMSIYLGSEVSSMINTIINNDNINFADIPKSKPSLCDFGIPYLPKFYKQNGDRNRTSPIAFCDNRFEFRAMGSSVNPSWITTILNTITAESMDYISNEVKKLKQTNTKDPLSQVIKDTLIKHQDIIYNGDGYSSEWLEEAKKRNLPIITDTAEALPIYLKDKNINLFKNSNVLSEEELKIRYEIFSESYCNDIHIELRCMINMCSTGILPAVYQHMKTFISSTIENTLHKQELQSLVSELSLLLNECKQIESKILTMKSDNISSTNTYIKESVIPLMNKTRKITDKLETLIDKKYWPYPSYEQMLFN